MNRGAISRQTANSSYILPQVSDRHFTHGQPFLAHLGSRRSIYTLGVVHGVVGANLLTVGHIGREIAAKAAPR